MGRYGEYAPHTVEYQIYRGEATDSSARTCRRIPVQDFEGQIRPDLALALLRRFQRISDRVTPFSCKFTYCFCAHMHEIVKYFILTEIQEQYLYFPEI